MSDIALELARLNSEEQTAQEAMWLEFLKLTDKAQSWENCAREATFMWKAWRECVGQPLTDDLVAAGKQVFGAE